MPDATLTVPATWTDDCQGKKDFDGSLVTLSTRYWPRGGSALVFQGATFVSDGTDPERQRTIPPSAHATIYLGSTANGFYDDAVKLADAEFSGETEAEVKRLVEEWAAGQYARIGAVLRREYGV